MKKLLLIIVAAATMIGCSTKTFTIDGRIEGLTGKVYLALLQGKTPQTIDSTDANAMGEFVFKGKVDYPMMALLQTADNQTLSMFMLENSPITITGSLSVVDSIKVQGSNENDMFRSMTDKLAKATSTEEYQSILKEFITSNPKSQAAGYALFRQLSPFLEYPQMREMASMMDTTVKQSIYIQKLLDRAATLESTSIGKQFVDFSAKNIDGEVVSLSSIAGKGQWVLLDFWASWCPPCRAENPHVLKTFNDFKEKGFTIFGYSLDRNYENWKKGIEQDSLGGWTNVSDLAFWESEPAATYGVGSIPSNVLIDPTGVIIARDLRGEELTNYLTDKLK